jgi:uncharacterized protein (DUF697 family)
MKKITLETLKQALDWSYENALNGFSFIQSAPEMAEDYMKGDDSLSKKADRLIRWQVIKAGTTGFLTGMPGLIAMPVTIPADLAVVLFIQIRMIATLAHMGGYDLHDDRVRTLVYACTAGNGAKDILKNAGIIIGKNMAKASLQRLSGKALVQINKSVGFRLLTKFGQKGVLNLGKLVPVVGGIIGGTFDSSATYTIGKIAKKTFINQ